MKKDLLISTVLAIICLIGGLFLVPYQFNSMQKTTPDQYELIINTLPIPIFVLSIITALQIFVFGFILSFIGIKLARKTGFTLPILDKIFAKEKVRLDRKGVLLAVVFGLITALVLAGADFVYYQYKIPQIDLSQSEFSLLSLVAGVLYGGVFEEIALRLFLMSLIVWLIMKLFRRNEQTLPNGVYWFVIFLTAMIFAAGHLPTTEVVFGELTLELIGRSFLLNGIGGIFFGYLYWKKGFEYGVLAHMFAHIFLQVVFIPLIILSI